MILSEVSWLKNDKNEWVFNQYCDEQDREWDRVDTGFLVLCAPHRIFGYCCKGHEEEWKFRLINEYIKKCNDHIESTNQTKNMLLGLLQNIEK